MSNTQLPTSDMVIAGFEAVSLFQSTDAYKEMSGCQGAAESARICWAAMVSYMPEGEAPRQDLPPSEAAIRGIWAEASWAKYGEEAALEFAAALLARYSQPVRHNASVLLDFGQIGTAGPFHIIDGRVAVPAVTVLDLVRMSQSTASVEPENVPTCRGSVRLGSGCRKCSRCFAEVESMGRSAEPVKEVSGTGIGLPYCVNCFRSKLEHDQKHCQFPYKTMWAPSADERTQQYGSTKEQS